MLHIPAPVRRHFLERLIPKLKARGLKIAIVKHDGHRFEIDHEGKDSDRFTKAGAECDGTDLIGKSGIDGKQADRSGGISEKDRRSRSDPDGRI